MPLTRTVNLHRYSNSNSGDNVSIANLDPITYNPRYPWFDEANYRKLESKIDSLGLTWYDKEKAISMLSTIEKPQNELWGFLYELKKVEYFLEEGKEEVAKQLFYELKAVPTKNKRILSTLNHVEQLHFQKDENIEFVKKLIFTSKQNKFLKAVSYIDLMEYYYLRNNIEEAKNYAEEFLMLKTNMTELENKTKKLLETIV